MKICENIKNVKYEQFRLVLINALSKQAVDSIKVEKDGTFSFEYAAPFGAYNVKAYYNSFNASGSEFSIPEDYKSDVYMLASNSLDFGSQLNTYLASNTASNDSVISASNVKPTASNTNLDKPTIICCILFPFNGSELGDDAEKEIENIVTVMKENPSLTIEVIGYTDSWGKDKYNNLLSENRAKAVKAKITKKGIATTRIKAIGRGKENPIAINENENGTDNPEGRTFNRRVEFKIVKSTNKNISVAPLNVPENLKIGAK